MKTLVLLATFVATLAALSGNGFGQATPASADTVITNGISLAMGSTDKVFNYLVGVGNGVYVTLKQGGQVKASAGYWAGSDSLVGWKYVARTNAEYLALRNLAHTTNWIDPDQRFSMTVEVMTVWDKWEPDIPCFWGQTEFFLVKSNDGTYHVPESVESTLFFNLDTSVPIAYTPTASWARVEVTDRAGNWAGEDDNFINSNDPRNGKISFDGPYLKLRNEYACSGDTGPYIVKVILVSDGQYMVFDGNGHQVAETPLQLSAQRPPTSLRLTLTGGDRYRPFALQRSADFQSWETVVSGRVQPPDKPWSYELTPPPTGRAFYRVAGIPDPGKQVLPPGP